MAGGQKQWLIDVTAYTLAGVATSTFVGASFSWLGGLLLPAQVGGLGFFIAIAVALIAIARELGWSSLPLPQPKRQTKDFWYKVFPSTVAATLWGLDLGLIFTTHFTFSGIWLLVVIAGLTKAPLFGAALFTTYWLGRVLSVWLAPWWFAEANATPFVLDELTMQRGIFQRVHAFGLSWAALVLSAMLMYGETLGG